jgi:LysR family glycine cleavage system transcriptional activator
MKRAAESLCVSPAAISQQVKRLEDRIGYRLFLRGIKGLELTLAGLTLYEKLEGALETIESAWFELSEKPVRHTRLVLNTTTSIANSWLIPRLANFNSKWPEIEISIEITAQRVDLRQGHVDVALIHGFGDYREYSATSLWCSRFIPVCSPRLLQHAQRIYSPEDCLNFPLLQDGDRMNWKLWLKALGINDKRAVRGTSFCDESLLIGASCAGHGIALVSDVLIAQELASTRLVQVINTPNPKQLTCYLVSAKERADEWAITAFRKWAILQTTEATEAEAAVPLLIHKAGVQHVVTVERICA